MQGANKQFINGKATWLGNNLILYNVGRGMANPFNQPLVQGGGGAGTGTELPVQNFDLRQIPQVTHRKGHAVNAYELYAMTDGGRAHATGRFTHNIRAYFLPWGSGRSYEGTLGNNADFFFTPTLNGCSFAASTGGNPRVVHSNHANIATQSIDQGLIDADLNNIFGVHGPDRSLKKATYKQAPVGTEDYRATIIGIRGATGWKFYYQRYKTDLVDTGHGSTLEITPLAMRKNVR